MTSARISNREQEVLNCLAKGLTTDEIAQHLYVSHDTIKTHRAKLMLKLKARNAFQLAVKAMKYNLLI